MQIEILLLLAIVTAIILVWGLKQKNSPIFVFGTIFLICTGIMLTVSGLDTGKIVESNTTKTIVDANTTTYKTINTYENISISEDYGLWAISWSMMIVGMILIPASLYLSRNVKSYKIT